MLALGLAGGRAGGRDGGVGDDGVPLSRDGRAGLADLAADGADLIAGVAGGGAGGGDGVLQLIDMIAVAVRADVTVFRAALDLARAGGGRLVRAPCRPVAPTGVGELRGVVRVALPVDREIVEPFRVLTDAVVLIRAVGVAVVVPCVVRGACGVIGVEGVEAAV